MNTRSDFSKRYPADSRASRAPDETGGKSANPLFPMFTDCMTRKVSVVIFGEWITFSFSIGSRFKVQWFGGSHAHFKITRPAEHAACHGYGKGKQGHKGKGKGKVTDAHASPLSMASSLRFARVDCAFHPARTPCHAFGFSFSIFSACAISAFSVALFVVMSWFGLVRLLFLKFNACIYWQAIGFAVRLPHGAGLFFRLCLVPINERLGDVRHARGCFVLVHRWVGLVWFAQAIERRELNRSRVACGEPCGWATQSECFLAFTKREGLPPPHLTHWPH